MYTVNIYLKICCDECNEVIHYHFDCPICNKKYIDTDIYHEIDSYDKEISCENCNSKFKILEYKGTEIELELIKEGKNDGI